VFGKSRKAALGALLFLASSLATAAPSQMPGPDGTWINPRGTVAVKAGDCGGKLCGWVSWANATALADAADAGVRRLVGTELLQDYKPGGHRRWIGRVYVPDMGRSFQSTIEEVDASHLKISGCILGGLLCKSQIWRRA
jgi:uncharacterized protein (DUF2147 family)